MGPESPPYGADRPKSKGQPFVYRSLRRFETPWQMRKPEIPKMTHLELRAILLPAVAYGNDKRRTSPFLHCTVSVAKAKAIMEERRQLYSNWLVRFPANCAAHIDLSNIEAQRKFLNEEPTDTTFLELALKEVRNYPTKDKECVYLELPPISEIEWWNEAEGEWSSVADAQVWYARRIGDKGIAATSQMPASQASASA